MAGVKISQLQDGGALQSTDAFPVARGSLTRKILGAQLLDPLQSLDTKIGSLSSDVRDLKTNINYQTSDQYTVQLTDKNDIICMDSSNPNTVIIPTSITDPGFQAVVLQIGTGQTTISAAPSVTLRSPVGSSLFGQYSAGTILYINPATQWIVYGDVVP